MTAPKVTQCPECKTAFRINQKHLEASNGFVRCGSCMSLFNAFKTPDSPLIKHQNKQPDNKQAAKEKNKPTPVAARKTHTKIANTQPEKKTRPPRRPITPILLKLEDSTAQLAVKELENKDYNNKINIKKYKKILVWSCLVTTLLSLIFIQLMLFNKNKLALDVRYRGFYTTLCQYLHCSLPPYFDIDKIKSLELIVQQHLKQQDTLLIDAVIVNEALYPQPYPLLSITFSDINGKVIANNIMASDEYLGGELTGEKIMQCNQPIRLSLEIANPGQKAVNYTLNFHADKILLNK